MAVQSCSCGILPEINVDKEEVEGFTAHPHVHCSPSGYLVQRASLWYQMKKMEQHLLQPLNRLLILPKGV
jgi:hypothetical protein